MVSLIGGGTGVCVVQQLLYIIELDKNNHTPKNVKGSGPASDMVNGEIKHHIPSTFNLSILHLL